MPLPRFVYNNILQDQLYIHHFLSLTFLDQKETLAERVQLVAWLHDLLQLLLVRNAIKYTS